MWIHQTSLLLLILVHSALLKNNSSVQEIELNLDPKLYGSVTPDELNSFISSIYKSRLKKEIQLQKNPLALLAEDLSENARDYKCYLIGPDEFDVIYHNRSDFSRELKFSPNYYNCGKLFDVGKLLHLVRKYSKLKQYTIGNDASSLDALSEENKVGKVSVSSYTCKSSSQAVPTCGPSASVSLKFEVIKEARSTQRVVRTTASATPISSVLMTTMKPLTTSTYHYVLHHKITDYPMFEKNDTNVDAKAFTKLQGHKKANEVTTHATIRPNRLFQQQKPQKLKKTFFLRNEPHLESSDNNVQSITKLKNSIDASINSISEPENAMLSKNNKL